MKTHTFPGNVSLYYHSVLELLKEVVESDNDLVWKYDFNQGVIHHPNTTFGWKFLEDYFKEKNATAKLLLPRIFIDEYTSETSRRSKTQGIYMSCANQKVNVYFKRVISYFCRNAN